MKAYAIFDGGGVKAAALAGCLAAAEGQEIEFVGYGGTSAGAIIATLASVGYTGAEIRDLLLTAFHPAEMLEDRGVKLRAVNAALTEFMELLTSKKRRWRKICGALRLIYRHWQLFNPLIKNLGLYTGENLHKNLTLLIRDKVSALRDQELTFEALEAEGCKPLKIVASDLQNRCAVVFEHSRGRPPKERSAKVLTVVDAVRVSAGYPLVFKPYRELERAVLVDGGLASNLPSFLYYKEQELTQFPILSFDLVPSRPTPIDGMKALLNAMLDTALEASDHLPLLTGSDVFPIPVSTPPEIGTLKFDLGAREINELYDRGFRKSTEALEKWPRLQWARKHGINLQKELRAFYGDQRIYQGPLWALATLIETTTAAKDIRAHIMLPTGKKENTRIVVYHHGFDRNDTDDELELNEYGGCSGRALKTRKPTYADLDKIKTELDAWDLTEHQQRLVCSRQRSMFSLPIFAWDNSDRPTSEYPIIGILSFDSSTPLPDTGWFETQPDGTEIPSSDVVAGAQAWSDDISLLLRARI